MDIFSQNRPNSFHIHTRIILLVSRFIICLASGIEVDLTKQSITSFEGVEKLRRPTVKTMNPACFETFMLFFSFIQRHRVSSTIWKIISIFLGDVFPGR